MTSKNIIKHILFCSILTITYSNVISQETVLKTSFTVRDFDIIDNTLLYIEKRDIKSYNVVTKSEDTLFKKGGFFIGGYGLKVFHSKNQQKIITASNELVKNRSSIRFYDVIKKGINKYHVLYDTELMDFYIEPKDSVFVLSKKDFAIDIYKYGGTPRYKKTDTITTDAFARKIKLVNNTLFYITDSGKVVSYNLVTKQNKLLYQTKSLLVNFIFDHKFENIFVATFNGNIIKINLLNPKDHKEFNFGNHIIEAINIFDDKYLIAADWSGQIKIIDIGTNEVVKTYNNKKRIVKIIVKDDYFYTSSSDKTIKKWKLDK